MSRTKLFHTFKLTLQIMLLIFSMFMIAEGVWGNQFAPKNLTTLFVWVHYRGFLVLALLFWGNLFCMSCPFIFFRNAMRIFITPQFLWPRKLQNKWLALILFSAVLLFYEYLNLWSSPKKTAILIAIFFVGALIIDSLFKKATFCKYICPIGQFNFLSSTISPKVIKAKNLNTCATCTSHDCLKGRKIENETLRGCELSLFIPKKHGSLDCTFCMDCIIACPHNNIELASTTPAAELWQEKHRSGIGTLKHRHDILFFIVAFIFLGIMNAFLMTGPALLIKEQLKNHTGISSEFFLLFSFFILFLLIIPILTLGIPEFFSRKISGKKFRLVPTLIPLGFGIWSAHYSFHFLTGAFTFIPLITNFSMNPKLMGLPVSIVFPIEIGLLSLGLLGSILVTIKLEENKTVQSLWIFSLITITLFAFWIFTLPMEMRGTFTGIMP